jgi:Spy/CpxP family protein refolding chaperone
MKTLKYALLMLALFVPAGLMAQAGGGGGQMGAGQHMPSVDEELDHLSQRLSLTDAQKPQVKAILQAQRDQMKQAMDNSSGSREETRTKMQSIHEASAGKIRALLTDDQKATWDRMQERRKQHMGDKHGEGAAPPPPQQ